MLRSNKAIAISGCLLHQSLMAANCATEPAAIKGVIEWTFKNKIGMIPWSCPETLAIGLPRETKGIERYRKTNLIEVCDSIAINFSKYLEIQINGGIDIIGIVGVSFSPACSARRQAYHSNEQGLFIQALIKRIEHLNIPIIDIHRKKFTEDIKASLEILIKKEPVTTKATTGPV